MPRFTPGGRDGTVADGLGRCRSWRAVATLVRSDSTRPASTATPAIPAVARLAARKPRRAGSAPAGPVTQSLPVAADGLITPPEAGTPGRPAPAGWPAPAGRSGTTGKPSSSVWSGGARSAVGSGAVVTPGPVSHSYFHDDGGSAVAGGPIRLISRRRATTAAAVAKRVGSRSATEAPGLVAAAISPTAANTASPAIP